MVTAEINHLDGFLHCELTVQVNGGSEGEDQGSLSLLAKVCKYLRQISPVFGEWYLVLRSRPWFPRHVM